MDKRRHFDTFFRAYSEDVAHTCINYLYFSIQVMRKKCWMSKSPYRHRPHLWKLACRRFPSAGDKNSITTFDSLNKRASGYFFTRFSQSHDVSHEQVKFKKKNTMIGYNFNAIWRFRWKPPSSDTFTSIFMKNVFKCLNDKVKNDGRACSEIL